VESLPEAVKAEDYGFDSESKKKRDQKKCRVEPETEPEKEIKAKAEPRISASAEDLTWDTFESVRTPKFTQSIKIRISL